MVTLPRFIRKIMCMCIPENYKPQDYKNDGNDIQLEDTCEFTLPIQGGRVIKVYDADTITIAAKIPFKKGTNKDNLLYRFSVRLNGIDAPEMKGKGITEEEKAAAYEAQQFVYKLILNKYVTLKNVSNEKYGRILADVYIGDINLNDYLITHRYAFKYDGGRKIKPKSWTNYRENNENYM